MVDLRQQHPPPQLFVILTGKVRISGEMKMGRWIEIKIESVKFI